jgi:HPt (histidine-containing phosphotransfer) domain-containing protein
MPQPLIDGHPPLKSPSQEDWTLSRQLQPLAPRFLERCRSTAAALRPLALEKNFPEIRKLAGRLKTSSPAYGLAALAQLAAGLQHAAAAKDAALVERQIEAIAALVAARPGLP